MNYYPVDYFFFFLMIRRPPRSTLFPLHDALPISDEWASDRYTPGAAGHPELGGGLERSDEQILPSFLFAWCLWRSEEHTSELQSLRHLVCRLLLEKKKH